MTDNQGRIDEITNIVSGGKIETTPWLRFRSGKDVASFRVFDLNKGKIEMHVFHGTQERNGNSTRVQIDADQIDEVIQALQLLKKAAELD